MTARRRVPLDPDLYASVVEEAKHRFTVWPSAYASGWVVKTYKERGGKYAGQMQSEDTGLTKWFGEEWVDLSRPILDDDGNLVGYEPCGRKSSDDPADYPKCRPLAEAMQMTPEEVADAIRRKRRAERQVEPVEGHSRAPVRVPTYREDAAVRKNPVESTRQLDPSTGVPGRIPSKGGEPEDLSADELKERGVLFDTLRGSDARGGEAFDMQTAKALGQVPPVGTWRMDPVLGYLEQLQLVPVDELSFSESTTDPIIRRSVDKYVGYYQAGLQPPPAEVVWNEPTQRLITLNRRRVLAAKEAGVPSILAWVGGDTYENMKERTMRRNPAELLLLNPAATRPLTMGEVQTVMHALEVPKPWRTRFMQGMDIEWREHGGGIDAHSVGALVIDHLNEDEDYYRRTRQNPEDTPRHNGILDAGRDWLKKREDARVAREAAERLAWLNSLPVSEEVRVTQAKPKTVTHEEGERVVMLDGEPVTTKFQWWSRFTAEDVVKNRRDPSYLGRQRMVSIVPYAGRLYAVSTTIDVRERTDETFVFLADEQGDFISDELATFRPHDHAAGVAAIPEIHATTLAYKEAEAVAEARQNPAVRIPKGMRPLIEAYGEQIAKLASRVIHEVTGEPLDVQWTPRTEPLGAGSWGVVYPTRDPRFIVKVTADPTEGPIVSTIMSEPQLHNHMGIIHYFALRKLPEDVVFRGKTFPVFVIIAERLKDVGGLRGMSWNQSREDRHLTNLLIKIKDVAGKLVHEKQKKRPSQRAIDALDEQYLDLVGQINDGPLSDFFFQFRDATETGVLADVHLNNLGKRAVDWETVTNGAVPLSDSDWHWVISDPGHSSVETHPDIAPLRENPRKPPLLTEGELANLPRANTFWMDFEIENGPEHLPVALRDAQWPVDRDDVDLAREVLRFFYANAPGNY